MAAPKSLQLLLAVMMLLMIGAAASVALDVSKAKQGDRGEGVYTLSFGDHKTVFQDWKAKFRHIHGDNWDEDARFRTFSDNLGKIENHNLDYHNRKSTFYMGLNQFSAMTHDEYQQYNHLGQYSSYQSTRDQENVQTQLHSDTGDDPDSVDWTKEGYVTGVKDQGNCESCWIFSAVAVFEGAYYKSNKQLKSFSEQQILECCELKGCSNNCSTGGYPSAALQYMENVHGEETEDDYPYNTEEIGDCKFVQSKATGQVTSIIQVAPAEDENALKSACAQNGPISVAIFSNLPSFSAYTGGVYYDPDCTSDVTKLDHAVLVTGYSNTSDNVDYWLVKNSWGETWGLNGYVWMARNRNNSCGIADLAVYPVIAPN